MSRRQFDRRVFVDTSAYFAFSRNRDEHHRGAYFTMQKLVQERRRFVTTNFVVAELHALLIARASASLALEAAMIIRSSSDTSIVRVRARDEDRAWQIVEQYADKEFSFADAASFAVMERLGINTVFALDQHFAQYGWNTVPLDLVDPLA